MHTLVLLSVVAATLGQPPVDLPGLSPELQLSFDPPCSLQFEADGRATAPLFGEVQAGAEEEAPAVQPTDLLAGKLFFVSAVALAGALIVPQVLIDQSDTVDQGGMAATVMVQVGLFGASGFAAALGIYHLAKAE